MKSEPHIRLPSQEVMQREDKPLEWLPLMAMGLVFGRAGGLQKTKTSLKGSVQNLTRPDFSTEVVI